MEKQSQIKLVEDMVKKNEFNLDQFLNASYRIHNLYYQISQEFFQGKDMDLDRLYRDFKIYTNVIDNSTKQLNSNYNKVISESLKCNIDCNEIAENYDKIMKLRGDDILAARNSTEINYKFPLFTYIFASLLEKNDNGIIKDFIKSDNNIQFQNGFRDFDRRLNSLDFNTLFQNRLSNFLANNKGMQIKEFIPSSEDIILLLIKVSYSFKVFLRIKIDKNYQMYNKGAPNKYILDLMVAERKEKFNMSNYNINSRNNNLVQFKGDFYCKSKYLLFRKLNSLLSERFNNLLRGKSDGKTVIYFLFIFLKYLSGYVDLFNKKCEYCGKIAKFNIFEKSFYPPYYRYFDLEKQLFFHEDCFAIVNNKAP